jgi:uncharacterized membrane protein YfcA
LEILGYIAAVMIGVSLGMIGGGGSILTVPALVYLVGTAPVLATAYSLFIVGSTSLVGGLQKYFQGYVDVKNAVIFGIPSIIGVYTTRKYIVTAIPEDLGMVMGFHVTKNLLIMLLFAVLMVLASVSMIRKGNGNSSAVGSDKKEWSKWNYIFIILEGLVVGAITGFVGAGGGFLIIPALVLLTGLPMKQAVGTSLIIIAAKSLLGFLGDISNMDIDWPMLGIFTLLSVGGIFIGNRLSKNVAGEKLKTAFGWFVLVMGIYIIARELMTA